MFDELRHSTPSEVDTEIPLHSLHNRNLALNSAIVEARETGKDRREKYIAVKVMQENGCQLRLFVNHKITKRNSETAKRHTFFFEMCIFKYEVVVYMNKLRPK